MAQTCFQHDQSHASEKSVDLHPRREEEKVLIKNNTKTNDRRKTAGLTWGTVARSARDRGNSRELVRALCATPWNNDYVSKLFYNYINLQKDINISFVKALQMFWKKNMDVSKVDANMFAAKETGLWNKRVIILFTQQDLL